MFPKLLRVSTSLFFFAATIIPSLGQNPGQNGATATKPSTTTMAKVSASASGASVDTTNVPLSKTVVTIHGLCNDTEKPSEAAGAANNDCVTRLTRRQMETVIGVVEATGRTVLKPQRRDVAVSYVDLMANAAAAEKAGVDRDPRFAEVLRLARMKALNDMYQVRLDEEANKVTDAEIRTYYEKHLTGFEELTLSHISLPRYNSANLKDPDFEAKAKKLADDLRARSAKGEDMEKLEKEAMDTLGLKTPPSTKMAPVRRGVFAKEQEEMLFSLKRGEVSKVVEQPSAFIIFKLERRGTPSMEELKSEIHGKLYRQKLDTLTAAASASVHADYSDDYFGAPSPTPWVHMGDIDGAKKAAPKK